jgi:hypothetical protein
MSACQQQLNTNKSFQIDHYNGRVNRPTITKHLYDTQHTEVDVALLNYYCNALHTTSHIHDDRHSLYF